jgi:hypothetical protein
MTKGAINMNDSQKLDQILAILNKQQLETYIPTKWKSVVDYCEHEDLRPEKVLELLILVNQLCEKMNRPKE